MDVWMGSIQRTSFFGLGTVHIIKEKFLLQTIFTLNHIKMIITRREVSVYLTEVSSDQQCKGNRWDLQQSSYKAGFEYKDF
jgi:hypothetical protein